MSDKRAASASAWQGRLFILLSAVCWSMGGLLVKSSVWSGLSIAIYRGVISFAAFRLMLGHPLRRPDRMTLLVAVCFFAQSALYLTANKFAPAGIVTALEYTSSLYIIIGTAIAGRRLPHLRDSVICALLLLGVFLTATGGGAGSALGCALALISGFFYAGVFAFTARSEGDSLEPFVWGNALYLVLIPLLFRDSALRAGGLSGFGWPTACALVCGVLAWFFFQSGIQRCSALQANFIAMAEPVLSPVWPLIFLGERMSPLSLIGCALVVLTLCGAHLTERGDAA